MTTLATVPGGEIPRHKSWGKSIRKGVFTGAAVGVSCAAITIAAGTWGDYPTRMLIKTEARILFSPAHVVEAKVLRGGPKDPAWVCWGPGHPVHACQPFLPDKDMPPSCIEPIASFPIPSRPLVREIYGGTGKWGPPHPCPGIQIGEKVVSEKGVDFPPHPIPEWVMPAPEK